MIVNDVVTDHRVAREGYTQAIGTRLNAVLLPGMRDVPSAWREFERAYDVEQVGRRRDL